MRDMENKGFGAGECDFLILDSVQIGRQTFYGSFRILLMQNDKLKRIKVNIGSDFIFRFQSWLNYKERKIALIPLPASQQFPTPPPEIKLDQQMHISALLKGGSYEKQCVRLHDCLLRIDDKNLSDILRGISSCEQVAFVLEALKHARQCLFSSTDGASKTVLIR